MEATSAAAAALWAFICHWDSPRDAIVGAVHAGWDTDTIACIAGALGGALHGSGWVPQEWFDARITLWTPSNQVTNRGGRITCDHTLNSD